MAMDENLKVHIETPGMRNREDSGELETSKAEQTPQPPKAARDLRQLAKQLGEAQRGESPGLFDADVASQAAATQAVSDSSEQGEDSELGGDSEQEAASEPGESTPDAAEPPRPERLPKPRQRIAYLVTHGMGQQVPFETLSSVAQALLTKHAQKQRKAPGQAFATNTAHDQVTVRRVQLDADPDLPEVSRVEVVMQDAGGKVEAHLYEAYWAPLTEGQITFVQTVSFLFESLWNGLSACLKAQLNFKTGRFNRWMFGQMREMRIKQHTSGLLLLLGLLLIITVAPAWLIFVSPGPAKLYTYLGDILAVGLLQQVLRLLLLAGIGVFAWFVYYALTEYVGDVAIYVSSYKVSRFDAIRKAIQKTAATIARQIYKAKDEDGKLLYDSVVLVGHSLGSVVTYDLLNACINWDEIECKPHVPAKPNSSPAQTGVMPGSGEYEVCRRTRWLITFGSPLDKTAFLFRTQISDKRNLREALAARQQPLILSYDTYRRDSFRWINIYSKWDIINGSLEYYDSPDADGYTQEKKVQNETDPQATRPLLAHNQYWNNDMLHQALYAATGLGAFPRIKTQKNSQP